ncbi:hypothetical protein UA08_02730 [Talaromyces atroroseus]|uniref:Uncharacterized protein n=1 Tax=Talaromyces atroroseus TaxID=1441469 RepID=A0A225B5D9_TALAT|nr:hypothetical protein UA08_02730 [Talaromyces atroroseus]OKL62085.1 hypothetical protein UA08_02730 [Talaromyces atroroseus]
MCRTSQALYVWCQCEEAHVLEACHSGRSSSNGSCDSVASETETVYLQCFCRYHATNGFTTARKDQRLQKKADKKKNKRRSMDSAVSVGTANSAASSSPSTASSASASSSVLDRTSRRFRRSWTHIRKLSFV